MHIHRIWKQGTPPFTPREIWEYGDEQWESTFNSDEIRHFRVISRRMVLEEIHEQLLLLPESPIPLEALVRHSIDSVWVVEESVVETPQELPSHINQGIKEDIQQPPVVPLQDQTCHELLKLQDPESLATMFLLPSYNLPMELWCSLSQWIPSSALFQPSLHLQADLELSGTPTPTSPVLSKRDTYSRSGQAQYPRAKRGLPTRNDYPKTEWQSSRDLGFQQEPLFI
jgi:hypothetical protein